MLKEFVVAGIYYNAIRIKASSINIMEYNTTLLVGKKVKRKMMEGTNISLEIIGIII